MRTPIATLVFFFAAAGCGAPAGTAETSAELTAPVAIASGLDQPGSIAVDDQYVYFVVYGDAVDHGSIRRVKKSGGAVTVLANGESGPGNLVLDGASVYWTSNDYSKSSGGAIRAVAKRGGRPVSLASGLTSARALVADSYALYFADDAHIEALSKSGGVPLPLAPATCTQAMAQDSTTLYWTENCVLFPPQGIFAVSKLGGLPVVVSVDAPGSLFADGAFVYWVDRGIVTAQPRFGGLPIALYDTGNWGILEALDATSLYLQIGEGIARVPKTGGSATTIWSGDFAPNAIATDASALYFDGGYPTGAVYRLAR
jgi:hypothetical protein